MANGDRTTLWERILGTQLRPHERKLLLMKREFVEDMRKNPKAFAHFKRTVEDLKTKDVHVRIDNLPGPFRDALRKMDSSGLPTENRAIVTCIVFQMQGIVDEVEGTD